MPGAELREAEDLLRAAAVGGGERAHEALPVPPDSGADDLAEAERAADRRNVQVHARAQERQHVAAPAVLSHRRQRIRPDAPPEQPGGELRGPRIQLGPRAAPERRLQQRRLELAAIAAEWEARERRQHARQADQARRVAQQEAGDVR